jgi:hypothetical protein
MNLFQFALRRQFKTAANLLQKEVINEWQYSALAILLGHKLMGAPLKVGTPVQIWGFAVRVSEFLGAEISSEESLKRSLATYGPYNMAAHKLKAGGKDLVWSSTTELAARAAALQLSPIRRAAFRFQEWWKEQESILPLYTKMSAFIFGLLIGAVIGLVVARLTHG